MPRTAAKRYRILLTWILLLAAGLTATLIGNVALARYVQTARDNDPNIYLDEAEKKMNAGEPNGAWASLELALQKNPRYPRCYKVQGDLHYRLKEWAPALESYRQARELGSREAGVIVNSIWSLIELERYDEAIRQGQLSLRDGMREPLIPRYVSEAYARAGRIAEAIPHLELALKTYEDDLYLLSLLRHAYSETGQDEKMRIVQNRISDLQGAVSRAIPPATE